MKSRTLTCFTAITLFTIPLCLVADGQQEQYNQPPHYSVIDLGTLGGTFSVAEGITDRDWVNGTATLEGDTAQHAFLWREGVKTDLGTLGGPNSSTLYPANERGRVVGGSETSAPDPLGEDFCGFGTNLVCLPFVWQKGVMTSLPTLGGKNGSAFQINNRGQVVGQAENSTKDPTCAPPQILQYKPVLWGNGHVQELPTFPGDPEGGAGSINDEGQAIGGSGNCTFTGLPQPDATSFLHALLWKHGTMTDLGNLGGTMGNVAQYINNKGQVVGNSNLPGDSTFHAFLWTERDGMQDMGTLPGDLSSLAFQISENGGTIVGASCQGINVGCRAALWHAGVMTDLNTLIPAGSQLFLVYAFSVNARGKIVGLAQSNDGFRAFLAIPCDEDRADEEGCEDEAEGTSAPRNETSQEPRVVIPENVRKLLLPRLGFGRSVSSPQNATLSDAAAASRANVTLSPTSLTFPTQIISTTSAAKTVTLKNTGTASLTIRSIAITGTNVGDFAQTHTCGRSLAAGASCRVSVTFKPAASGTRSAELSITDNARGSPQKVSLSGTGTTTRDTLTGFCWGSVHPGAPQQCGLAQDLTQCPAGQPAITPTTVAGCLPPQSRLVDTSRTCQARTSTGKGVSGYCVATFGGGSGSGATPSESLR